MIRQRSTFSFSEYFYALDLNSYRVSPEGNKRCIDAVWFKKKSGTVAVCSGVLSSYSYNPNADNSLENFMNTFDGRYGGSTKFKWDGTEMWSENNNFLQMIEAHRILDPILTGFANIPAGYSGWYSIKG